jgi:hypothetical protein
MTAARVLAFEPTPNEEGLKALDRLEAALDEAVRLMGHELASMVVIERLDLHEEGMLPNRRH